MNHIKILAIAFLLLFVAGCASGSMEYRSATTAARTERNLERAEEWGLKALNHPAEVKNAHVPYFLATEVYKPQKKYRKMAEMLEEALRRNPSQTLEKPFRLGDTPVTTIAEGVSAYKEQEWGTIFNIAVEYYQAGELDKAIEKLEIAKILNPSKAENFSTLSAIYIQLSSTLTSLDENKKQELRLLFRSAKEGNDVSEHELIKTYGLDVKQLDQASFEEIITSPFPDPSFLTKAENVAHEGLKQSGGNALLYQVLADVSLKRGDLEEASLHLQEALNNTDNPGPIIKQLVFVYIDQGKNKEAIDLTEELLNKYPNDADLYYNVGVLYQRLAVEAFDPARELYLAEENSAEDIVKAYQLFNQARSFAYNSRDYFLQASDLEVDDPTGSSQTAVHEMKKLMQQIDDIFIPSVRQIARENNISLD